MVNPDRIVALVGRPNVGKSRLFNRLAGARISIVHDQPGVTRDLVTAEIDGDYTLMDTGGIGLTPEQTPEAIASAAEDQVEFAIQAASVVLFVTDGRTDLTPLDERIAEKFRGIGIRPVLVVNKMDNDEVDESIDYGPFVRLGFGDPFLLSAEHGRNVDALRAEILSQLGPAPERDKSGEDRRLPISFIGRPNVGKSSLANALLDSERLIVSDVPGTTRDAVSLNLDYNHDASGETWRFQLMDTAGLRTKKKVSHSVEYFSTVRTQDSIERSEVVYLVLDARDGVARQDQRLAGEVLEMGKPLVILVNKWDYALESFQAGEMEAYADEHAFRKSYAAAIRRELFFLPKSPILFVSAKTGLALETILKTARDLDQVIEKEIPTGELNRTLQQLMEKRSPKMTGRKRFKVFYAVQTGKRPVKIRLFCNQKQRLEEPYRRYLEHGVMDKFDLDGCPILFDLVGKEQRFSGPEHQDTREVAKVRQVEAKKAATEQEKRKRKPSSK